MRSKRRISLASWSGENECPRCGEDIESWSEACKVNDRWIHKRCHGGADDD